MRDGLTPQIIEAINAPVITTAYCIRLDLQAGPAFLWTGVHSLQPQNTGDSRIDGQTFEPLAYGVVADVSANSFSYSGSNGLTITVSVPADVPAAFAAAQTLPAEYQARNATIWRAIKIQLADPLAAPMWHFKAIRTGTMTTFEENADGMSHRIILTIESHQGRITNATNQTWLDQPKYDANDTSQRYATSIANGDPAPAKASYSTPVYGGSNTPYNIKNGRSLIE